MASRIIQVKSQTLRALENDRGEDGRDANIVYITTWNEVMVQPQGLITFRGGVIVRVVHRDQRVSKMPVFIETEHSPFLRGLHLINQQAIVTTNQWKNYDFTFFNALKEPAHIKPFNLIARIVCPEGSVIQIGSDCDEVEEDDDE